jgi:hypothetical protein
LAVVPMRGKDLGTARACKEKKTVAQCWDHD